MTIVKGGPAGSGGGTGTWNLPGIDGGFANVLYLVDQDLDGGYANSSYVSGQTINGGDANGD
jgi:hypothetical protein